MLSVRPHLDGVSAANSRVGHHDNVFGTRLDRVKA